MPAADRKDCHPRAATPPTGTPRHTDWTRVPTRPGPHADPLDDTQDEGSVTPVQGVAIKLADQVRIAVEGDGYPFSARDFALLDALALEASHRIAEIHARQLATGAALPRRVHELEAKVAEHDAKHRRLTGEAETNGRLGRIEARIAATVEERAAEKATIGSVHWSTAKLLALFGVVAISAGGGIVTTIKARDAIAHAEGRREQRLDDIDRDVSRLFSLFNLHRTTTQEPHE